MWLEDRSQTSWCNKQISDPTMRPTAFGVSTRELRAQLCEFWKGLGQGALRHPPQPCVTLSRRRSSDEPLKTKTEPWQEDLRPGAGRPEGWF